MDDLDSLVRNANNFNIAKFLTDGFPHPYTSKHGKAFIELATKDNPIHIFEIVINGQAVGGIGIHPQSDLHRKMLNSDIGLLKDFGNRVLQQEP